MAADNARRRAWPAVAVLLAAVLTALGVSVATHGAESRSSGAAADSAFMTVAPARAMARLAVEPSPVATHGHDVLCGAVPDAVPPAVLPLLGGYRADVTLAPPAVHRPRVGDRAPPLRLLEH